MKTLIMRIRFYLKLRSIQKFARKNNFKVIRPSNYDHREIYIEGMNDELTKRLEMLSNINK